MDDAEGRWSDDLRSVHAACVRWAADLRPRAGGSHLDGAPLPLALTDATWLPRPDHVAELGDAPDAWPALLLPLGDVAEAAARAVGYGPTLDVAIDDPWDASPRPGRITVHDAAPVGWDAAHDVATVIMATVVMASAQQPQAGGPQADGPQADGEERAALTETLATVLASEASHDPDVGLHLVGAPESARAAAVSIRTSGARTIVLSGGDAKPLVAALLDEARAVGRRGYWARLAGEGDVVALRRWERARSPES